MDRSRLRIWNVYLHKGLMDIGFSQSKVDECVYTKQDILFMVYVDDGIIIAEKKNSIDKVINIL